MMVMITFNYQSFPTKELESLGHLSLFFSKQSSSHYQQLVLALQMLSQNNSSSPINIYFGSNAQAGVYDISYLILERKSHELSRTATNFQLFVDDS